MNNTYLFPIFGKKDFCKTRVQIFRAYSTANAVTTSTFWSKLLPNGAAIVQPATDKCPSFSLTFDCAL